MARAVNQACVGQGQLRGHAQSLKSSYWWVSTRARDEASGECGSEILENVPKVPIFMSVHWVVTLHSQGSQLGTDSHHTMSELAHYITRSVLD